MKILVTATIEMDSVGHTAYKGLQQMLDNKFKRMATGLPVLNEYDRNWLGYYLLNSKLTCYRVTEIA